MPDIDFIPSPHFPNPHIIQPGHTVQLHQLIELLEIVFNEFVHGARVSIAGKP